jgi:hypothetical protein
MSKEFDAAMLGVAARTLLDTDVPLTRDEVFPQFEYGKVLSKGLQINILNNLLREKVILESKKNGVVRYFPIDRRELAWIAEIIPPTVGYDYSIPDEDMKFIGKEGDKRARISVALRALKRLLASEESPTSNNAQSRTSLFIAKKGDKFQQRQVLEETWQRNFLTRLIELNAISLRSESKIATYAVFDRVLVQNIVDNRGDMCIYVLLFPDEKCMYTHGVVLDSKEAETSKQRAAMTKCLEQTGELLNNETELNEQNIEMVVIAVRKAMESLVINPESVSRAVDLLKENLLKSIRAAPILKVEASGMNLSAHDKFRDIYSATLEELLAESDSAENEEESEEEEPEAKPELIPSLAEKVLHAKGNVLQAQAKLIEMEEKKILIESRAPDEEETKAIEEGVADSLRKDIEENGKEVINKEWCDQVLILIEKQEGIIQVQGEHIEKLSKIMNGRMEISQKLLANLGADVTHVHSKLDKLHKDQESLKSDVQAIAKVTETASSENSLGSIRKRLVELEKLVTSQGVTLENNNKLIKTGLSEAALAMVDSAAKTFINTDRTEILQRMETMEEGITNIQGHVDIVLDEVQKTLEKLCTETKSRARMPMIVDRINTILKELDTISSAMPDISKS